MENNGYFSDTGTIWNTSCDDDSIWIFYMEAKSLHTTDSDDRTRPRLQEVGRYYYKAHWPAKNGSNGAIETQCYF